MPCSNAAKTQNTLKFVGVPQTPEPISAVRGRSSPYYENVWRRHCCLTSFFSNCRYMPYLQRHSPTKLCDGAEMAIFLRHCCVLYFKRAACSTFQTCILNSHKGHAMCRSMVDIRSTAAEIRRGKKRKKERNYRAKI